MHETRPARLIAYAVAVLGPALSLLLRWPLWPVLEDYLPHMTFLPAVALAAYYGGFRPGLLATLLSAVAADSFLLLSQGTDKVSYAQIVGGFCLFVSTGAAIGWLSESLHRSRRRAAANERRYAVTLSSIGDAVIATDEQARITFLNPAAEALTGWTPADAAGRPLTEVFRIVNEQTRQPVEDPAAKVLRLGTVVGLANHTALLSRDGRETPIDDCGAPIVDERGAVAGVVLVFRDVTQRRQAEEAAALGRFRALVQNSSDVISLFDGEGTVLYQAPSLERLLGYAAEERIGRNVFRDPIVHPEDMAAKRAFFDAILSRPGAPVMGEFRLRHADGSWRDVEAVGQNFLDDPSVAGVVANYRDVTERRRAEEESRRQKEILQTIFDHIPVMINFVDPAGRLLLVNRHWEQVTGWSLEEARSRDLFQEFYPDEQYRQQVFEYLRHAPAGWRDFETRVRDGRILDTSWAVVHLSDGTRIGIGQDVTERKRAEEALRASEAWFRFMANAMPQIVWTARPDGSCDYLNQRCEEYSGVPAAQMLEAGWLSYLHPDDRDVTAAKWMAAVDNGTDHDLEFRLRAAEGVYRWFKTRGLPVRDESGRIVKWLGTCTDVDDQKRAEEALRESEHRWRSLTEALPQLVWTATADGSYDYFSTQWTQHTGVPQSELLGWRWLETLHPDDRERTRQAWTAAVQGPGTYDVEFRVRRSDGVHRWFKTRGVPIRHSESHVLEWFGTCTDVTTDKQLEEELRQAKEAAESANRAKDEFLANVSHEIRTPMNAILGMTDLALDTDLTGDQRQCLRTVKSAADNLLGMINDLLDFAKIEAGKMELDPADFSLRAVLGDTLRALAVRAHKKGLELIYHVQPEAPDALVGDSGRLRQVLLNLVGNAIKFTEQGEVVVRVELAGEAAPEGDVGLRFSVRDTGIGIPPDRQDKIFRAFEQEDTSTTRKYGGTGLGLTIAARLTELMGGTISVQSEPGKGSTFAFTARLARQPQPSGTECQLVPPVSLRDLPVLVVDDNATNRHILQEWLRGWQMEPVTAGDGVAAMDALWHGTACGRPYPLVLLDARMPDTDGLALAARIRERAELSATRIILLTSGDRPGDLARSRELRLDAHLLKPVQQDELLETIYRVMGRTNGNVPPPAGSLGGGSVPAPAPAAEPLHVLVAEDNEFNAQLLEQLLTRRGHRVRLANNGRDALSLAEEGAFDLLLLDVHMPELDGFGVVQAVRERERAVGGHLPIVALTARSRNEDRETCLAAGMDDFLAKPIQAAALWAAIDRAVAARPQAGRSGSGLLAPRVLLAACGGDAAILEGVCKAFRAGLPDHLAAVGAALREGDAPRLREAAHKLCGMVAAFSTVAGGVASELEDRAARGHLEEARPLVGRLSLLAEELMRATDSLSLEVLREQAGG